LHPRPNQIPKRSSKKKHGLTEGGDKERAQCNEVNTKGWNSLDQEGLPNLAKRRGFQKSGPREKGSGQEGNDGDTRSNKGPARGGS